MSAKIKMEYNNPRSGGRELVIRDGDQFFINSDWGKGYFPANLRRVSRQDIADTMRCTDAPAHVVARIFDQPAQ